MSPHNFEIKKTIDLREVLSSVLSDGLHYIGDYGLDVDYSKRTYQDVAGRMTGNKCWEDVLVQMLIEGHAITFVDTESDDDEGMTSELTLEKIQQTITDLYDKNEQFSNSLDSIIAEDYDAGTSDALLQFFLYGEIIF